MTLTGGQLHIAPSKFGLWIKVVSKEHYCNKISQFFTQLSTVLTSLNYIAKLKAIKYVVNQHSL